METPYSYVWEYDVRPGCEREFEAAYGPGGDWAQLFRQSHGYVRTELLQDRESPRHYVTVDFWQSFAAWQAFRRSMAAEFEALDAICDRLTEVESAVGRFRWLRGTPIDVATPLDR